MVGTCSKVKNLMPLTQKKLAGITFADSKMAVKMNVQALKGLHVCTNSHLMFLANTGLFHTEGLNISKYLCNIMLCLNSNILTC